MPLAGTLALLLGRESLALAHAVEHPARHLGHAPVSVPSGSRKKRPCAGSFVSFVSLRELERLACCTRSYGRRDG